MKKLDTRTTPHNGYLYTEPETGVQFKYNTWAEMVENVSKHRLGMALDLSDGWTDRLQHDICEQNQWMACQEDAQPYSFDTPLALAGRQLWGELHAFAEQYPESPSDDDKTKARYWMARWRERIPRFSGCQCRENWARLEASYPPDYSSREAFVKWASNGHDWVNRKTGKPLFRPDWFNASPAKDI